METETQRSELDELIDWLENRAHNIKQHNIALPDRSVKTRLNWLACLCMVEDEAQRIHSRRQSAPEDERQKHEPDWQAECADWRRGVGAFMEWMLPLVLEIPGECGMDDTDSKRALDSRMIYALVYRRLLELCPQAQINWNAPPPTPGEIAEINQIMRDEGLIE